MSKQNKKDLILAGLVVALVVAVTGYSIYTYQTQRKPAPQPSVAQLTQERNDAVKAVVLHEAVYKHNLATADQQTAAVQAQLVSVCASLKTTKVANLNCQ